MRVLNIEVPVDLLARWAGWYAPDSQPFLVDVRLAETVGVAADPAAPPAELRDTYELYEADVARIWLSEAEFGRLPRPHRAALVRAQRAYGRGIVPSVAAWAPVLGDAARAQADGYRFVWWPSLLRGHEARVLTAYVEEGRRPSRHDEVPAPVWATAARTLPGARALAGTFAAASGPNCLGTVMAAAGVAGAATVWMQREPFEEWLAGATVPGGRDDEPGTVLVWRSPDGPVQHAAVTLGGGWALHKPSQGWMSPAKVLTVPDVKRSARQPGRRLHRYALLA